MVSRWTSELAPWLPLLPSLGKLYRPLDDEGDRCVDVDGVLWFDWKPSVDPEQWPRQVELLALLARLLEAARRAFEALLSGLDDAYTKYFVAYRARYETPYRLGVYVRLQDEDDFEQVLRQLTVSLPSDPESEFLKAEQALVGGKEFEPMPVFVEVLSTPDTTMFTESALRFVHDLLQSERHSQPKWLFQVSVVQASHVSGAAISHDALVALGRLADCGICIPRVVIETSATLSTQPGTIVDFVTAIQSLLGVRGVTSQPTRRAPRLQHLTLRPPFSMHIVIALCTAIANSETLQRVSVDAALNENRRQPFPIEPFWRWLAYALFSRGAASNVSMLEIDASMLLRFYVQGMQSVAQHEDALVSELDPRLPMPSPWKDHVVDIPSDTELTLIYDFGAGKDVVAKFVSESELLSLRVLQEDDLNGWLCFVLPGWGECRVARDSASPRAVQATQDSDLTGPNMTELSSPRAVRHLRLHYATGGTLAATEQILQIVGTHVRRLDIHEPEAHNDNIGGVLLGDALRHCPNLEEIDIFGAEIDSLDVITDTVSVTGPHVKKIKLRQLTVRSMASVHRFFDGLADLKYPMTKHLVEVSFHIVERTIEDQSRGSILNSCTRMLQNNTTVRACRAITLSKQRASKFAEKFGAFDGQPLPARKAPLALSSKLAFLSVITEAKSSALQGVDVNLLANIFQLAAENEIRESSVEVAVTYEHSTRG